VVPSFTCKSITATTTPSSHRKKNITSRKIIEDFDKIFVLYPLQENTRNPSNKKALLTFSND
jgi:hypothetical protein